MERKTKTSRKDKKMNFINTCRNYIIAFIIGTGVGAYGWNEHYLKPQMSMVAKGYCGQLDPTRTLYWYSCRDSYIANELLTRETSRAIEIDEETGKILANMQQKGKRK